MEVNRISIDDALGTVGAGTTPRQCQEVRALEAVRRVAVALDQIARRSNGELKLHGRIRNAAASANAGDLAEARHQFAVLNLAAGAVDEMVRRVEAQLAATGPGPVAPPAEEAAEPEPEAPRGGSRRRGR